MNNESELKTEDQSSITGQDTSVSQPCTKPNVSGCLPKIFCFINSEYITGDLEVIALSEDGEVLDNHLSSSKGWAKHDIGINSDWKHESYKAKYHEGYELRWLESDECDTDEDFIKAIGLSNRR